MKNVAVIGAGIVGLCTSFFLQKNGFKVTLIDQNMPGSGTSYGHACTFADYACVPINSPSILKEVPSMLLKNDGPLAIDFIYLLKNLPWSYQFLKNCKKEKVEHIAQSLSKLLSHSRYYYDEIFNEIDVENYINNNEALYLYSSKKEYEYSKSTNDLRIKNNVKVKDLSKEEIKEIEPNIADVYYRGHLFEGTRYTTNPMKISSKIFDKFIEKGGSFIKNKVISIGKKENSIELSLEDKKTNFDKIILSTGAWTKELALKIGDKFPLDTEKGYHVLFSNTEKLISRPIGWSQSGFYIIQIEEGIRSAGTVEIAGLNSKFNNKRVNMIEKQTRKLLPNLNEIKSTWVGYRPTLPDSLPVIDRSKSDERIFYAFGHQHIGWTTAAVTGKIIQYLMDEKKPNFDISSFRASRFN